MDDGNRGNVRKVIRKAVCSVSGKEVDIIGIDMAGRVDWINCVEYPSCGNRDECPLAICPKIVEPA